ncbi:MAG: histidinol dehydrogenase [Bacteroidia bacterium]
MRIINDPDKDQWEELLARPLLDYSSGEATVKDIIQTVRQKGDKALKEYAQKFDRVTLDALQVTEKELNEAESHVSAELKKAIYQARENITLFHAAQKLTPQKIETQPGVICWRKNVPIAKVGLYIPGGTAPLFSTLLMLGIPGKLAGCQEMVICTPPDKQGKVHPAILFTANLLGITQIFKVGGAQAIAAMAYGTESIPRVYKIFGPGNQYVTLAKQLVSKDAVAIDMPAGPSEVAIVADESANPAFVAADLLSQAEHGLDSQVLMVTTSKDFAEQVNQEVEAQLERLPRAEIARGALENSRIIILENLGVAMELINQYAPEHLILAVENDEKLAESVMNAGSVFLGNYTPESAGDYASGTNHTLPTNGFANAYSGVSLDSFVKKITFQKISETGIQNLGPTVEIMAEAEELLAHKEAVSVRLNYLRKNK